MRDFKELVQSRIDNKPLILLLAMEIVPFIELQEFATLTKTDTIYLQWEGYEFEIDKYYNFSLFDTDIQEYVQMNGMIEVFNKLKQWGFIG